MGQVQLEGKVTITRHLSIWLLLEFQWSRNFFIKKQVSDFVNGHASYKEVIYEPFISLKEQPAHFQCQKGKFLTPWFLAPFILYYITQYMSPISRASTNFFLDKQNWIPDWWNILDLWSFLYTIIAFFLWVKFIEKRPIRTRDSLKEMAFPNSLKVCWWVPSWLRPS